MNLWASLRSLLANQSKTVHSHRFILFHFFYTPSCLFEGFQESASTRLWHDIDLFIVPSIERWFLSLMNLKTAEISCWKCTGGIGAEPASQRLCINLTCSFWAGACQVTPYVVVLLWCYSSSLVKKWLSDVLLFLWQPCFHQSGSSGGCFCMCPSINTTCAVLKLERFEDNRSAAGDVRQAADRVASWIGSLKSRTGVITLIKVHTRWS